MDRSDSKYSEKRNFIRMKVDTPANVVLEQGGGSLKGVCRDLSGGGMLIETSNKLDIGLELNVTLTAHHVNSPMLKARVQVARVKSNPSGSYTLGMEILEILD